MLISVLCDNGDDYAGASGFDDNRQASNKQ